MLSGIDRLLTALLKIFNLDSGTAVFAKETVPLKALIDRALSTLLIPAKLKEQSLTVSAEVCFSGDPDCTVEIITNIVKNCMEHTPEGGNISLSASENALFSEIVISDNGCGIAKEDFPHIFERFYKGKNFGDKGFGIGLALARTVVASQNEAVKAKNINPHGARFAIRFYKEKV